MELYKKHRPRDFKDVHGQGKAVRVLEDFVKRGEVPHSLLFCGPSGCGKTTLARIMRHKLGCGDSDFCEINAAESRGIEMVREINARVNFAPISGKCRVWLLDEAQKLTGDAQSALLTILEDTPRHAYFMICTTEPDKLLLAIRTRCTRVEVAHMDKKSLWDLLVDVSTRKEKVKVSEEVITKLVDAAEGSARSALVLLDSIIGLKSEDDQLEAIRTPAQQRQASEIFSALLNPKATWPDVAKVLQDIDEDPEKIRRGVLTMCSNIMMKSSGKKWTCERCDAIIDVFRDNWYDCGKAGLVSSCYKVVSAR